MTTRTHILLKGYSPDADGLWRNWNPDLDGHYIVWPPRAFDNDVSDVILEKRGGTLATFATFDEALSAAEDDSPHQLGWMRRECQVYTDAGQALEPILSLESTIIR